MQNAFYMNKLWVVAEEKAISERGQATEKVHAFANHCNCEGEGATQYRAWKWKHSFSNGGHKSKEKQKKGKKPSSFAFSREINMHYTHIYELAESWVSALDIL